MKGVVNITVVATQSVYIVLLKPFKQKCINSILLAKSDVSVQNVHTILDLLQRFLIQMNLSNLLLLWKKKGIVLSKVAFLYKIRAGIFPSSSTIFTADVLYVSVYLFLIFWHPILFRLFYKIVSCLV